MQKFINAWLLPLLLISSNGVLGWLINQLPSKPENISPSVIISLTVICIVVQFIITLLSSNAQQNSTSSINQNNWVGGLLPLLGGVILAVPLSLKLVPAELTTAFSYVSMILFGLGAILPPVLILPLSWRKWLVWLFPGVGLFTTVHFILKQQSIAAIVSLFLTGIVILLIAAQEFFKQLIREVSTIWSEWQRQGAVSVAALFKSKVEDWWSELTSPFKREYYQALYEKCRDYETQGLDKDSILNLYNVFVPLKISAKDAVLANSLIIPQSQLQSEAKNHKEKQIWDFLAATSHGSIFRPLVILGAPGSGKTTLLRHLTLIYATQQDRKVHPQPPKLIPILLYFKDVHQEIVAKKTPLATLITEYVKQQRKIKPLNPPDNWFKNKLEKNQCLVMLDGLDEVANEQEREKVRDWVDEQIEAYPNTAFILTSRPFGYKTAPLQQQVTVLEVQPFNLLQIQYFIRSWYLETEIRSRAGQYDLGVQEDARQQSEDLINRINKTPSIAAMAVNPLLLTMIATVHRRGSALPGKRVDLYKEICQVLLEKRQRAKKIPDPLIATQKQAVLQVLALKLMQENTKKFDMPQGIHWIENRLATVAGKGLRPEDFFKQIRDVSGLLVEKELNEYEFAHLSFQEYLAAVEIKESKQEDLLIANINDSWWAETIRLYAAQSNATELLRAFLAFPSPSVEIMALAYDCKEECLGADSDVQENLIQRLEEGLESTNPEIFKLASQVRLARRLKNMFRLDEQLEIDNSYITCAEYQLFLDETGESSQPQHIPRLRFAAGDAKKTIIGISWENAHKFCAWLKSQGFGNQQGEFSAYYRLPTEKERTDHPLRDKQQLSKSGIRLVRQSIPLKYNELADYLWNGKWKEADLETAMIIANMSAEGSLNEEDFGIIDDLWVNASNGRIGFSIQKSIYQKKGGRLEYKKKIFEDFSIEVGWQKAGRWLGEDELSYDVHNSRIGHLPALAFAFVLKGFPMNFGCWDGLEKRLEEEKKKKFNFKYNIITNYREYH
ncbi:NACHT domain-containing protein [Scytonema sp. UIC 10036]|uniref:GUN4 domain-containing protein n=1 Tax=Scytonema sp. UIC 10036 TaxID=2304196 RepID=UPI0012DAF434|nr:GUN4 domain-containing protein [Scytonema sp. UIC 10036]MUG96465.1 NACHT domain-containing protein [Scytonema sp. UIC 10036]